MNKLSFIIKFVTAKGSGAKRSKSVFLPVIGLALGIMIVLLTLAIMNGMEEEVFSKLRNFHSPAKLKFDSKSLGEIENVKTFLDTHDVEYFSTIYRNAVIKKDDDFRFISVIAVDDIGKFADHQLGISSLELNRSPLNPLLIGNELGYSLNLSPNDECELLSPVDINLATGSVPKASFQVNGIFDFDILNIDMSYAIIPLEAGKKLFDKIDYEYLLLDTELDRKQLINIQQRFPTVQYISWEDEYESLVSAMKLEKIAYSFFGFIIIFISAFNLLSIMSMMVMRKIPQLGILMAMGMNSKKISEIFLVQAGLTVLVGSTLGGILTYLVFRLNEKYQLLKMLLSDFPLSNFPLIISWQGALAVIFGASMIIMLAGFYPAVRVSKLNPVDAIDYIK